MPTPCDGLVLHAAGKATLLHMPKSGEAAPTIPTIGINVDMLSTRIRALLFETSEDQIRSIWRQQHLAPAAVGVPASIPQHHLGMKRRAQRCVGSVEHFETRQYHDIVHEALGKTSVAG